MTVTKVGGANMIAHAQCPLCPPFPRVAVFYVTPASNLPSPFSGIFTMLSINVTVFSMFSLSSDSFTILGLWVLGLAVSNINESQLQTFESKTLFLMTSLQYYCIPGLAETR